MNNPQASKNGALSRRAFLGIGGAAAVAPGLKAASLPAESSLPSLADLSIVKPDPGQFFSSSQARLDAAFQHVFQHAKLSPPEIFVSTLSPNSCFQSDWHPSGATRSHYQRVSSISFPGKLAENHRVLHAQLLQANDATPEALQIYGSVAGEVHLPDTTTRGLKFSGSHTITISAGSKADPREKLIGEVAQKLLLASDRGKLSTQMPLEIGPGYESATCVIPFQRDPHLGLADLSTVLQLIAHCEHLSRDLFDRV